MAENFCRFLLCTTNTLKRVAQNLLLVLFKFSVEADLAEKNPVACVQRRVAQSMDTADLAPEWCRFPPW